MSIYRIHMFKAGHGDCLCIEYGDSAAPSRVLIDGGTKSTYKRLKKYISTIPADQRRFDLLIVTHIDADHIAGILKLVEDDDIGVSFDDVWYNAYHHLPGDEFEPFGVAQGEKLSKKLSELGWKWNQAFGGGAIEVPGTGALPSHMLPGGMKLTLLSPGRKQLLELKKVWKKECQKAGLDPHTPEEEPPQPLPSGIEMMGPLDIETLAVVPFSEDTSEANGSSIAVIAEFDGHQALLSGDAHPSVLITSMERLDRGAGLLTFDVFKLPHHGSKANVNKEILARIDCQNFMISTNGAYFDHPDKEAVARIIKFSPGSSRLLFNCTSDENSIWQNQTLMDRYGYDVAYPGDGTDGYTIEL
jgi:beta-lactamase superfamily II metal-dependent hydrolase